MAEVAAGRAVAGCIHWREQEAEAAASEAEVQEVGGGLVAGRPSESRGARRCRRLRVAQILPQTSGSNSVGLVLDFLLTFSFQK